MKNSNCLTTGAIPSGSESHIVFVAPVTSKNDDSRPDGICVRHEERGCGGSVPADVFKTNLI